jgi:hypothetical protein
MAAVNLPVITIHNCDLLAARLADVERDVVAATESETNDWVRQARDRLEEREYPPELPGQRYRRTYNLKYGFVYLQQNREEWLIYNAMQYSSYVVGEEDEQAEIHKGRWWIAREVVEEGISELDDRLAARYQHIIDTAMATV